VTRTLVSLAFLFVGRLFFLLLFFNNGLKGDKRVDFFEARAGGKVEKNISKNKSTKRKTHAHKSKRSQAVLLPESGARIILPSSTEIFGGTQDVDAAEALCALQMPLGSGLTRGTIPF
jgi:hypothetical protein